ncbi:hypothetical protein E8E78_17480 [Pseudomonas sp. BN505]|nr:hypothetical protein [Pseudomonas sp. BN605]MDH4858363.1 hypothetical protein [Pseudomonas sp. BN505]
MPGVDRLVYPAGDTHLQPPACGAAQTTLTGRTIHWLSEAPVGAGLPAKKATRCMAPAAPVFAGEPAPTGTAPA